MFQFRFARSCSLFNNVLNCFKCCPGNNWRKPTLVTLAIISKNTNISLVGKHGMNGMFCEWVSVLAHNAPKIQALRNTLQGMWVEVEARLVNNPAKLWSLNEMERTGGEPDVVALDGTSGEFLFYDCSSETPSGRRNVCYDQAALVARKKFPPKD